MNLFETFTSAITSVTNGWFYIAKDINGTQTDGRISITNVLKPVSDVIVEIQDKLASVPNKLVEENKTDDFSITLPANSLLISGIVVNPIASTPTIKIGTTMEGEDIFPSQEITEGFLLFNPQYIPSNKTIYFTVDSGTLTIKYLLNEDFI